MRQEIAIITGGTRGIGLGIAKIFAANGYRVAVVYCNDDDNARKIADEFDANYFQCIRADITNKHDRDRILSVVEERFGGYHILINNAGIIRRGRLLDITEEDYRAIMGCNLDAPVFLSQAFAKKLVAKKQSGSIVNILSVGAYRAGNLAYCASKAGLLSATKSMAQELAKHNIRVNSVSPFGVATELNRENREANPESWDKLVGKAFIKRASTPEEIASAVLYLASDTASFVTGVDIPVDGGYLAG